MLKLSRISSVSRQTNKTDFDPNAYSNVQKKGTDRALVIMPKNGLLGGVTWQKEFRWCHSFCAPKIHDIIPWTSQEINIFKMCTLYALVEYGDMKGAVC